MQRVRQLPVGHMAFPYSRLPRGRGQVTRGRTLPPGVTEKTWVPTKHT